MDIKELFKDLDKALSAQGQIETLYICGGAALLILGVISRETQDVDVLDPKLSPKFLVAAKSISSKHGLSKNWLNNQVENLAAILPKGWMKRSQMAFKGSSLTVFILHRDDLIASKLFATCNRDQDLPDLIALKPSKVELEKIVPWVKRQKDSKGWPLIVDEYVKQVLERQD